MAKNSAFQRLDTLAVRHIAPHTDLTAAIQQRLAQKPPQRRPMPLLRRMVVLSVCVLLSATTLVALNHLTFSDAGLQAAYITELNLTQTKHGTTATLKWAYADLNRIVVAYSVTREDGTLSDYRGDEVRLTDADGQEFTWIRAFSLDRSAPAALNGDAHFDASPIEGHPNRLDLRLELRGGFVFDFRLPFHKGVTLLTDIMQEEANGVTVTLKWLKLAPSMTRVYFCYTLPPAGQRWYPGMLRLSFDGQRVGREAGASYSLAGAQQVSENEWCQEQAFLTAYTALPREVTFTLDGLQTPIFYSEANMQRAAEVYARYGINAQVIRNSAQETASYMLNFPNMTASADVFEEASTAANAAMGDPLSGERFAGEWTFSVPVPR